MRPLNLSVFLLFSLLLLSTAFSTSSAQKKLIVLGDSLTEGYGVAREAAFPALLEKKLQTAGFKWTVINAGVSGSTTASANSRLKWLFKSRPDAVLLILGANDGLRGIKTEDSEKNLALAIDFIQKEKVKVILGGLYMPPNYGKEYTEKFRKMYSSLAKKYSVPLIPFVLDKVAGDSKLNQADGIHPNEAGHKIVADHIFATLKGEL